MRQAETGAARTMVDRVMDRFGLWPDRLIADTLASVVPAVSSRFANSGMLDSSLAADTMSRSASEAVAPIEYGAWENQQGRKLSAAQALNQLEYGRETGNQNRRLSALQSFAPLEYQRLSAGADRTAGLFNAQQGRELSALGLSPELMRSRYMDADALMGAGQYEDQHNEQNRDQMFDAFQMAPMLSSLRYLDPQMLASAGGQQDQHGQSLIDSSMANYYEQAMRPYEMLRRASLLGLGFGGLGGTGTATQEEPGGGFLGTAGDIASIAATIGKIWSDRRLKIDVRRIGETAEGHPKYRFRYLWDKPGVEHIGVLADEVPAEITMEANGYKMVDYGRVTL